MFNNQSRFTCLLWYKQAMPCIRWFVACPLLQRSRFILRLRRICGLESCTGTGFFWSTEVFLYQHLSTNALYLFIHVSVMLYILNNTDSVTKLYAWWQHYISFLQSFPVDQAVWDSHWCCENSTFPGCDRVSLVDQSLQFQRHQWCDALKYWKSLTHHSITLYKIFVLGLSTVNALGKKTF